MNPNTNLVTELDVVSFDVRQQVFSNYLVFGSWEYDSDTKSATGVSIGIGLRIIHAKHNSPVPEEDWTGLYRLSEFLEREENGWYRILGIKLNVTGGRVMKVKPKNDLQ